MTQQEIMALTLYGEVGQDSLSVQEALACLIMNRVKYAHTHNQAWWGKTPEQVCLCPFQFSCWQRQDQWFPDAQKERIYQTCLRIASRALKGFIPDATHGATLYHDKNQDAAWALRLASVAQVGRFLFYKELL
ncbi:MAG: cell wall hydrolase [Alphaproteobacteria bacterium]|nr:cell wall hydrolase [Alphaproteobacteria bacterium]